MIEIQQLTALPPAERHLTGKNVTAVTQCDGGNVDARGRTSTNGQLRRN